MRRSDLDEGDHAAELALTIQIVGIAITPIGGVARALAVETNRPIQAGVAAQLRPDGSRSRLLSH